jgi:C4-dicarboxylate-specific signal transduction histidine kinase
VGGSIASFEEAGEIAADIALAALSGSNGAAMPVVIDQVPAFHVDARVMNVLRMDLDRLPAEAIVHFQAPSIWEQHRSMLLTGIAAISMQAVLIVALLIQRHRRRTAEELLSQTNEYMEVAANSARLGIWLWVPSLDQIWMTSYCRQMLGIAENVELDLDLFLRRLAGDRRDHVRSDMMAAALSNATFEREFKVTDRSGAKRWLAAIGYGKQRGRECTLTGTLVDVTDRKIAQIDAEQQRQQIIHLTRVAVLGELSGALAHELKQPLTAILTNAQIARRLILRSPPDLAEVQEILSDIVEDDHRAAVVLDKLRGMIRKQQPDYGEIVLSQVVDDVLTLVHSDLVERRVLVATRLPTDLPAARGDRVQMQQVLINLIQNACDAMTDAGAEHRIVLAAEQNGDDKVTVTVADSGGGLPAELNGSLFEPFITTKPQGLGLGLAICQSILAAHGGEIWCANNPGGGAIFGFSLPVYGRG